MPPQTIEPWENQLDEFVRDLTKVGWASKSLVKEQLKVFIRSTREEAQKQAQPIKVRVRTCFHPRVNGLNNYCPDCGESLKPKTNTVGN